MDLHLIIQIEICKEGRETNCNVRDNETGCAWRFIIKDIIKGTPLLLDRRQSTGSKRRPAWKS